MHNFASAALAGAMRPGLISGCYPERGEQPSSWIEQAISGLCGTAARLVDRRSGCLRKLCAVIEKEGQSLTAIDDAQLTQRLRTLRRSFHRQGLAERLCIEAFALIREIAGRTLGLRHYDAQLMGGWVLLQGQVAEMQTGEGKTLAATLAAATAALAGIPVHVITVNEYLVERDAQAMGPLYRALGLSVGYATAQMSVPERRAAYACDIAYCTNKQVAFDYLRDRLILGNRRGRLQLALESAYGRHHRLEKFLLRGVCFAILDEADSVLIDEARTPLILTRSVTGDMAHQAIRDALNLARSMVEGCDFVLDVAERTVSLTMTGQARLAAGQLSGEGLWQSATCREELVGRALHALHLLRCDRDYLVRDGKVQIIDANTGRSMPDHSWEQGLHQMVEAKEQCPLTPAREQLGRLTYQRFFRRYLRLGGMSGTAREVAPELWSVYGLRVRRIPLHRPSQRLELPEKVLPGLDEKWMAVIEATRRMHFQGRPVLIGTGSVADSELLSAKLEAAGIAHRLLNARQDEQEAQIVALAGQLGQVTVATNMAGRGTDIPLGAGVAELGGLHVIAACRNEAGRIDRQLYGRAARQGDPGSHEAIISLEDELVMTHSRPALIRLLKRCCTKGNTLSYPFTRWFIRGAQRRLERRHREARRALLHYERRTGRQLAFSGPLE